MQPEITVAVDLKFGSKHTCGSILNALIPDNVRLPEGLTINFRMRGTSIFISIVGSTKVSGMTVANTLDEVLEHISVASRVITNDA